MEFGKRIFSKKAVSSLLIAPLFSFFALKKIKSTNVKEFIPHDLVAHQPFDYDIIDSSKVKDYSPPLPNKHEVRIVTSKTNEKLNSEVCTLLNTPEIRSILDYSQNNESNIRFLDTVRGAKVFVLHSLKPPFNQSLIELFLTMSALKRAHANKVIAFLPYLPYNRRSVQLIEEDGIRKTDTFGEDIVRMLCKSGCDYIVTINLCSYENKGYFSTPLTDIDVSPIAIPYLASKNLERPVLITKDTSIVGFTRAVSLIENFKKQNIQVELGVIFHKNKEMEESDINEATEISLQNQYFGPTLFDRDIILVDNVYDSGRSYSECSSIIKKLGANKIYGYAIHGIFSSNGEKNLENSFIDELLVTNTLPEITNYNEKIRYLSIGRFVSKIISDMAIESMTSHSLLNE